MANTVTSPNMNLPVPTVGVDPGPDWANNLNSCLGAIDSHNHSPGQGVSISPSGLNISSDLPFNNNNATTLRSTRFQAQGSNLNLPSDLGCLYVSGVDLFYNDENGNQIRITQSGSIVGTAGSISGLPSGTASVSYAAGTYTFQSATNTPGAIASGPVSIGNSTVGSPTVTLAPNNAIASNYSLSLPAALPGSTSVLTVDNSGNVSYNAGGSTGTGSLVLATSPTIISPIFNGTVTGSIQGGTWVPSIQFFGSTPSVHPYIANFQVINSVVTIFMSFSCQNVGSGTVNLFQVSLPVAGLGSGISIAGSIIATGPSNIAQTSGIEFTSSTFFEPLNGGSGFATINPGEVYDFSIWASYLT